MSGWKRKTSRRRLPYVLGALLLAAGLLIMGGTLAYFRGRDVVTNRTASKTIEILLTELRWQESGREKAAGMEPGMVIEKDPCVYNNGETSVYVRMKLVLEDAEGNEIVSGESERYESLLAAIYCGSVGGGAEKPLLALSGEAPVSQNPAFEYEEGWFYYRTDGVYTVLAPEEATPTLFDFVKVPVKKAEYNGVFDQGYRIVVVAQAVSSELAGEEAVRQAFEDATSVAEQDAP